MVQVAEVMAQRLNQATAPVRVAIPAGGYSFYNRDGLHFRDLQADRAFVQTLRSRLKPGIAVTEIQSHVNDPLFISETLALFEKLLKTPRSP
jgi:uncharacterized protein (UPF0261 family)